MRSVISFSKQNNYALSLGTIQTGWKWLYISSFSGHLSWWGGTVPFLMLLYSLLLQGNKLQLHPGPSYWLSHVSTRGRMSAFLISSSQKNSSLGEADSSSLLNLPGQYHVSLMLGTSFSHPWAGERGGTCSPENLGREAADWLTAVTAVLSQRDCFPGWVKYLMPSIHVTLLLTAVCTSCLPS